MTLADVVVIAAGAVSVAGLAWVFFQPRRAAVAKVEGGVQTVEITVKGRYSPNLIRVESGKPVRLRFDRQESSDCTAKVVFPDFRLSSRWPPSAPRRWSCRRPSQGSTGLPAG
jgi:P-type Cu+ transporter